MEYATPWQRQFAHATDILIISLPFAFIYFIGSGWFRLAMEFKETNDPNLEIQINALKKSWSLYNLVFMILYGTLMEAFTQKGTLGKRLFRIRTRNILGQRITFISALKRNIGKILAIPVTMTILFDPKKRGGHDYFADTIVIKKNSDILDNS